MARPTLYGGANLGVMRTMIGALLALTCSLPVVAQTTIDYVLDRVGEDLYQLVAMHPTSGRLTMRAGEARLEDVDMLVHQGIRTGEEVTIQAWKDGSPWLTTSFILTETTPARLLDDIDFQGDTLGTLDPRIAPISHTNKGSKGALEVICTREPEGDCPGTYRYMGVRFQVEMTSSGILEQEIEENTCSPTVRRIQEPIPQELPHPSPSLLSIGKPGPDIGPPESLQDVKVLPMSSREFTYSSQPRAMAQKPIGYHYSRPYLAEHQRNINRYADSQSVDDCQVISSGRKAVTTEVKNLPFLYWPNPVEDRLYVRLPVIEREYVDVTLRDETGQVVMHRRMDVYQPMEIEVNTLNSGKYYLHIQGVHASYTAIILKGPYSYSY